MLSKWIEGSKSGNAMVLPALQAQIALLESKTVKESSSNLDSRHF